MNTSEHRLIFSQRKDHRKLYVMVGKFLASVVLSLVWILILASLFDLV